MTRLLVMLPNWFGETLFVTPLLNAIRHGLPGARVTAAGRADALLMLKASPLVDSLVAFEDGSGGPARWPALMSALRRGAHEAAVILRPSLSRSLLAAAAGVPQRIGWSQSKSGWALTHRVAAAPQALHKAERYLALLRPLGCPAVFQPYAYAVSEPEAAWAAGWVAREQLRGPLAVLHPGANWPHKRWPASRFAELADRLQADGLDVAITGAASDADLADEIRRSQRSPIRLWTGQLTVRQLAACLVHARLVVAADTGILHLAAALGRPVVGLYGPTSAALTGPLGDLRRIEVIQAAGCCPVVPCFDPGGSHPGMSAIPVEAVHHAVRRLLERG